MDLYSLYKFKDTHILRDTLKPWKYYTDRVILPYLNHSLNIGQFFKNVIDVISDFAKKFWSLWVYSYE